MGLITQKRAFFVPLILSEGYFINICVLPQYIVYWIYFQNIHTFTNQKTLLHTLFCLFLKSSRLVFSRFLDLRGNFVNASSYQLKSDYSSPKIVESRRKCMLKKSYFEEHLRTATSDDWQIIVCWTIFKNTTNPLQLFVEKHQFFNQNNQWLNNIINH